MTTVKGFPAERAVLKRLEEMLGKRLMTGRKNRTLVVGYRSNGEEIKHEFDIVSEDRSVIGEVKSDRYSPKAHANTRLPRVLCACRYLELINAPRKLLILTDQKMYEKIKHDLDGLVKNNIEIMHVELS
jgi:hypothetical protein